MAVRYKVVPPVRDVAFLRAVAGAVPLVPGSVEDCCTRIRDRTEVPARDDAREWLTFCTALGLTAETDRGYHRVREGPDREALAGNFRERVLGAREVLSAVGAEGPLEVEGALQAVRPVVPRWERSRHADWEAEWRERTARLLGWGAELGLLTRGEEGYRLADARRR